MRSVGTKYDFVASNQLAAALERQAKPFTPAANGILFRQGENPEAIYYLRAGEVTLTMRLAGMSTLSIRVAAGSLLGLPAIVADKPYSMTAIAETDSEVYRITCDEFKLMIGQDSRLCFDVLRILASEVHSARVALGEFL